MVKEGKCSSGNLIEVGKRYANLRKQNIDRSKFMFTQFWKYLVVIDWSHLKLDTCHLDRLVEWPHWVAVTWAASAIFNIF